jgi:PHD/YefM family antitoxin component YafN of YafNO toxin-antitoxin module
MRTLPQIEPITRLQKNHGSILRMLANGPVILTQHSKPAAVMIAPDQWDNIAKRLQMLETVAEARRIEARNDANNSWTSGEEMRRMMAERGVNVGD